MSRRRKKKKSKEGQEPVVRIEELEKLIEKYGDEVDPETIVSMYLPHRKRRKLGAALLHMDRLQLLLLGLLLVCGIATCLSKNLLVSLVIYMAYSVIMSIIWALLEAPDLAITEAAVGAGVSSVLLFLTLKKIRSIRKKVQDENK